MADTDGKGLSVRLSDQELVLIGLFRQLDRSCRAGIIGAAHAGVDELRRQAENQPLTPPLKAKRDKLFQAWLARLPIP